MSRKYALTESFGFAFKGLAESIKKEPNFRIHLGAAIFAILLGLILGLSFIEWALIITAIGGVFTIELINTSLESLVNLLSPEKKEEARVAKDVAAAAVFAASVAAFVVGLIIFLPKIFR